MKKLTAYTAILFLLALTSCSSSILTDVESIKESGNDARGANNTRTITFNCQDSAESGDNTILVRKIAGSETTLGVLPDDPVKDGLIFAGWWTAPNGGGSSFHADTIVSSSITVYAKWSTSPVYTVSFDTHGGSPVSVRKVIENGTLKSPGIPEKKGYLFGGWFRDEKCETPWNFTADMITKDTVLYAKWDSYTWTVAFTDSSNPKNNATIEVTSPACVTGTIPSVSANASYFFAGWWTGAGGTGTQFTSSTPVTGDIIVYAFWSSSPVHTVSFDSLGGSPVGSQTIGYGKKAAQPDSTSRDGYIFTGWFSEPNGKGKQFSTSNTVTADKTWYAYWSKYRYTVTFDSESATVPADPETMTVESPAICISALPSIEPEKTGYIFDGWYTGKNGEGFSFTAETPVTDSITVYASWRDYEYTVTFDMQDKTASETPLTMTVASPEVSLSAFPEEPTRIGYLFGGWFANPEGTGERLTLSAKITANTKLYAKWIKACTINFSANGGTGTMKPQTVALDETTQLKTNTFVRTGFSFAGWALTSYGTSAYADRNSVTATGSNMTLHATWTINTYTISYDPNGGTGKMNDVSMEYNKITTLNSVKFSRDGYSFVGWATKPAGAVVYPNLGICTMGAENIRLYAAWKYNSSTPDRFFTVSVTDNQTTITGMTSEWKGTQVVLPNIIDGNPVTTIAPEAFDGYANLVSISVDPASDIFASKDGVLYSKDMTVLYRFPAGKTDTRYAIPETVTEIAQNAFGGAAKLASITVPESVTRIGDQAFSLCVSLSSMTLKSAAPAGLGRAAIAPNQGKLLISVPEGSAEDYRTASGWSVFGNYIQ